jgi:hypothetical protein
MITTFAQRVTVTCPLHGDFEVQVSNHIKNWNNPFSRNKPCGCGQCGKEFTKERNRNGRLSKRAFVRRANAIHSSRYTYVGEYTGTNHTIEIKCPTHGLFTQQGSNHLRGTGCPKCKNSRGQTKIAKLLTRMKIEYIQEHTFEDCVGKSKPLKFDFWLPTHKLLIEYDGEQHFKPVRFHKRMTQATAEKMFKQTQTYDKIKNEYATQKQLRMLRIPYTEKMIADILHNHL